MCEANRLRVRTLIFKYKVDKDCHKPGAGPPCPGALIGVGSPIDTPISLPFFTMSRSKTTMTRLKSREIEAFHKLGSVKSMQFGEYSMK